MIAFLAAATSLPALAQDGRGDVPPQGGAQDAPAAPANQDWPCKQILVDEISLPAVWAGPSIDKIDWRDDEPTETLVAQIAARKTPIEAATSAIDAFAASAGASKNAKLTALFAGVFETLNNERTEIIDGLLRYSRKQKALATKIRSENAQIQKAPGAAHPTGPDPADTPEVQKLQWDLRLFEEGRKSLTYACEAPTLVEQRLFALARTIQNDMD